MRHLRVLLLHCSTWHGFLFSCGISIKNKLNCNIYPPKYLTDVFFFLKFCYSYDFKIGKRISCHVNILSVIILLNNKPESRFAVV